MFRFLLRPWPKHPIDRHYDIETSSRVMRRTLRTGDPTLEAANIGYAGSQPSVVRHALEVLPKIGADVHFFDLGCGKARVLVVATEYPFGTITGVELSGKVCGIARRNVARLTRKWPGRTPVSIVEGDATTPDLPGEGTIVLFLYNPFRRGLVERLMDHLEAHAQEHPTAAMFLVYYNPTHAEVLDALPMWDRYFAQQVPFNDEDRRYAPFGNASEGLAIWQRGSQKSCPPLPGADREIRVTIPDLAAEVVEA